METDGMLQFRVLCHLTLLATFACAPLRSLGADKAKTSAEFNASKLPPPAKAEVEFVRDVRPLFEARCWKCHGDTKHESGLSLHRRDAAFAGGDSGKEFEPGKS